VQNSRLFIGSHCRHHATARVQIEGRSGAGDRRVAEERARPRTRADAEELWPLAGFPCPDVRKAANSVFPGQAGVDRDERKKLQRASCQRRGFQLVVPIEEEMGQCPVLVMVAAAIGHGRLTDVEGASRRACTRDRGPGSGRLGPHAWGGRSMRQRWPLTVTITYRCLRSLGWQQVTDLQALEVEMPQQKALRPAGSGDGHPGMAGNRVRWSDEVDEMVSACGWWPQAGCCRLAAAARACSPTPIGLSWSGSSSASSPGGWR
jgi:hypothetical protein